VAQVSDWDRVATSEVDRRLRGAARRLIGGDCEEIEDLVQETWIRAWEKFAQYDTSRSFFAWTYAILVSLYRNRRRKRCLPVISVEELCDVPDPSCSVEDRVIGEMSCADLMAALEKMGDRLPEALHRAVQLYAQGVPYREAAAILGVSPVTYRTRIYRVRGLIRALLREYEQSTAA
jgi:RNA polymerase sigma-70 factor (ECF subfamily)